MTGFRCGMAFPGTFRRAAAAAVAVAVLAAGTAAAQEARRVAVEPVARVAAGAPPRITDIGATTARLRFESTVPLACSVVFGTTRAFGSIATDQDMAGGAHRDHGPLLSGLEPDTEYFYRVQGAAADGTLYAGEVRTFRTAKAAADATNLLSAAAGARIAAVSSNYGNGPDDGPWGAAMALDGDPATAWSSQGDGDGAFLAIDLPGPARIETVEVWTRTMADGSAQIRRFTLTTDTGAVLGPFTLPGATRAYRFAVDVVARSLRLDVIDSSGGNTGLVEFAAYGAPQ